VEVEEVDREDILCTVVVGGQLRSRKGLNIPGIDLGTSAFTARDRECIQFALENGVDAIGQYRKYLCPYRFPSGCSCSYLQQLYG
ncbi:MAG: hypothetical protein GQ529_02920, partial [Methyloprofundus sp.]|nr:hypothetical protein [Methyloprofundus sp.]